MGCQIKLKEFQNGMPNNALVDKKNGMPNNGLGVSNWDAI